MGLDIYLEWSGKTDDEKDKQMTGYQVAGDVGYLRSSYNESGFNQWASRHIPGMDLYWIFDYHGEDPEFTPDWDASLERARQALAEAEKVAEQHDPVAMRLMPALHTFESEYAAINFFKEKCKEHEKWKERNKDAKFPFDWFSCREGHFYLEDSPKVLAVMEVKGVLSGRDTVLICEPEEDQHKWYVDYIKNHIIPFIELGKSKPGAWTYWSG